MILGTLLATSGRFVHPQTPTTTPLYRRVARNPPCKSATGLPPPGKATVTRRPVHICKGESGWDIFCRLCRKGRKGFPPLRLRDVRTGSAASRGKKLTPCGVHFLSRFASRLYRQGSAAVFKEVPVCTGNFNGRSALVLNPSGFVLSLTP